MNFPWTRHFQRYEYAVAKGYVDNKTVVDLGCGDGARGIGMLSSRATYVYGIDERLVDDVMIELMNDAWRDKNIQTIKRNMFNVTFDGKADVIIAIEVIEHMEDVDKFMDLCTRIGNTLFVTTPLVEVTGKTRNPTHAREYSNKDFIEVLSKRYSDITVVYQQSDLSITNEPVVKGIDSMATDHVVQMAWCEGVK